MKQDFGTFNEAAQRKCCGAAVLWQHEPALPGHCHKVSGTFQEKKGYGPPGPVGKSQQKCKSYVQAHVSIRCQLQRSLLTFEISKVRIPGPSRPKARTVSTP